MPKLQLSVTDFGRQLVETGDLDPVYILLWESKLSQDRLRKWLIAYWSFYHCGTSSWIVDQPFYWKAMAQAANSKEYPRGTERRHFRGELSRKSVEWLSQRGVPNLFDSLTGRIEGRLPLSLVMKNVCKWMGFGKWIAFKVADMLERLAICDIDFTATDTFLFDSPREGAIEVVRRYAKGEAITDDLAPAWALDYLERKLGSKTLPRGSRAGAKLLAPPRYDRGLGPQEYETVLCKWKSYLGGSYYVGHDIEELVAGLGRFPKSPTARQLLKVANRLSDNLIDYRENLHASVRSGCKRSK